MGVTVWGRGAWRAAEASEKCANEGSKILLRGGKTSSIGLPTVLNEHAANEVGSNEEKH